MNDLIHRQLFEFFVLLFGGIGMAMLRQLFIAYQKKAKPKKSISIIQEMLFWILSAFLVAGVFYYASYGLFTVHALLGFALGNVMWYNIWHAYRQKEQETQGWQGREEAAHLKINKSSILSKQEKSGAKNGQKQA